MTHPSITTPQGAAVLRRGLANFLVELAIALQNHGVYPPGHPFLARSAEGVVQRLDALLQDRESISFGVAHGRLVIGGVATSAANPVLSGLAERLHRQRIGAVTLRRGLDVDEASTLLWQLARDPAPGAPPAAAGPHAQLHPVSYAQLELTGHEPADGEDPADGRAAELWVGLARAALALGEEDDGTPAPDEVARAIEQHARAAAYDQVIVAYLLQLAEELRADGRGAPDVRRRLAQTVRRLSPAALSRLMEMGGDAAQRRRFLLDAGRGFAADAVVRLVEVAAEAEGQTLSRSLVRLLEKLAALAENTAAPASAAAQGALREQVERLVGGWALADPNPRAYTAVLDGMSRTLPKGSAGAAASAPEPERILETALEVDAAGPAVWDAVQALEDAGRLHRVAERLVGAPGGARLAPALWAHLCRPDGVRALLRTAAEAPAALDAVLARMGAAAVGPLLDEMADSGSRAVRRAALGRVVALGPAALDEVGRRMDDPRWFVVRNLLAIVSGMGQAPEGFSAAPFLRHADARVRREAFRAAFRTGADRTRTLGLALTDADAQVQRLGLAECGDTCPAAVVPLVCRRIEDPLSEPEVAALAVRVLGDSRDPLALAALVRLASAGTTLLGRVRLAPATPLALAALQALARGWAGHPAAVPVLRAARRSSDPQVRRVMETVSG
ncbi:MAG TPA: hypothetical protein VFT45_10705 [Longimicrobium sp.]|nr:hypothetical protein [Longimicrobium sp.]